MDYIILLHSLLFTLAFADKESQEKPQNLLSNKASHKRLKRDWIWNQMHIKEEIDAPLPHHVGKITSSVRNSNAKYIIEGEYANTIFKVEETSGDVYAFERLDREKKAEYELTALIIDRRNNQSLEPPSKFIIKVYDINDNVPVFVQKVFNGSVPEMSPVGTSVTKVTAVDADDPTVSGHATVSYQVIKGDEYFTIDDSGVIFTTRPDLDRETQSTYEIVVKAKDAPGTSGDSSTATVVITLSDINDNFPVFKHSSFHFKVPENISVGGEVGRVKVEDIDEPQHRNTKYSFVRGDYRDTFEIVANPYTNEGIIRPKKPLDFEKVSEYRFDIEATDPTVDLRYFKSGGSRSISTVTIEVTDVDEPPVFTKLPYEFKVMENDPEVRTLGSVWAHDPDAAKRKIRFSRRRASPNGDYIRVSDTGIIQLPKPLDREFSASYNITVAAQEILEDGRLSDRESHAQVHVIVGDENDNAPELVYPEEPRVCENAAPGKVIVRISATDKDELSPRGFFKFSLATEDSNFSLIENYDNTANITVKYGQFNRELAKIHYLPVIISDNSVPELSSTNTLVISVCKCNEKGNFTFCEERAKQVGVSIQALVAIFICIFTIIVLFAVLAMLLLLRKRHKKDLSGLGRSVAEIHEQLVRYDEEGGGEMDTTSYDVSVLNSVRKSGAKAEAAPSPYAQVQKPPGNATSGAGEMESMIEEKKSEADNDRDLLPYDTLHIYGYEGAESIAESLSSLQSGSSDSDIDYDFLNDWGPRFKMLAELYGSEPSEDFVY
ncbi:cadherin-5 isoform X1 [Empidonax traillii]|uniref:cadherin-5 isoform X1 n=1 Tax=Empidonax traillii TaxID=164674 RepID=UPI000FFD0082|nr:cadherin-5 isoform X1 [Empidonax traillii]XP_027763772.1 cadherin-5 isoform X1 [Empidonax traillii]XP_027763773.1 cadherin-5 isoform X1 [Empidonax traillii]XP_027763774.1 cadherin-5 isoform X1 [Empidonax traillii]